MLIGTHEFKTASKACFVHGRHEHRIREDREDADVAEAMVHCAVSADQACTIEAEPYRQPLQGDLLECLIEGTLQEGGVDGEEWLEPGFCKAGHHVHGM